MSLASPTGILYRSGILLVSFISVPELNIQPDVGFLLPDGRYIWSDNIGYFLLKEHEVFHQHDLTSELSILRC